MKSSKRNNRRAPATTSLRPSEVWKAAFNPVLSRRIADTVSALAEWRDRLPAARKRKLIAAWDDVVAGLADVMTRQSVDDASVEKHVAIHGTPPRCGAASRTT